MTSVLNVKKTFVVAYHHPVSGTEVIEIVEQPFDKKDFFEKVLSAIEIVKFIDKLGQDFVEEMMENFKTSFEKIEFFERREKSLTTPEIQGNSITLTCRNEFNCK